MKETDHRSIELFKALSSAPRLKILRILLKGPANVTTLTRILKKRQATVSQHLKILRDFELVSYVTRDKFVYYSIKKKEIEELLDLSTKIMSRKREPSY